MTMTARTAGPLRRGLYGLIVGGLLSATASAMIALPVANADPAPQCDKTVGQSVDSYLSRHPDVKQELTKKGQAESPGSPSPVLDYLNRHPDVRQHLITLSQQCAP
ncbi:MAG: heme-binding protein [Mycobacterium sp.]